MLVQQRDGINEREILLVVTPVASARRGERQAWRIRIEHVHRLQQPLRVAKFFQHVLPFRLGDESRQRAPFPLQPVNAPGLLGALIHRQRQAAILQLLIEINRRRRQKNHHRAFDMIFLRHHFARRRVFAGAGYR